jgi:hypothetical protein
MEDKLNKLANELNETPQCVVWKAGEEEGKILSGTPIWPKEVMSGAAGLFANTYRDYLETPEAFLFMNFLTFFGHLISDKVTLESELRPQPRLYTINLGESGDTRKSTSLEKTIEFFREIMATENFNALWGVGSAEGLAKALEKNKRTILILDELKALIQKMKIDGSVLLPCINTLFESNRFQNVTKKTTIAIDNAELCIMAASTLESYRHMFSSQFTDIGFINRFFIVIGDSNRKFAIPQQIPDSKKEPIQVEFNRIKSIIDNSAKTGVFSLSISSEANQLFEDWYFSQEKSVFTKRLDTYGHRLMLLLALNEGQTNVTPEIVNKTITLLNYQLLARKYADPIDADNNIAKLEERIRRQFIVSPVISKRLLERNAHKSRSGIWAWNSAIKNLITEGEIEYDSKNRIFRKLSD